MIAAVMYSSCFGNLELEMAGSVGAGSLGRRSPALYSLEKSGAKPLKEAVEQTGEIERRTITGELDAAEEESTDNESEIEDHESEGKEKSVEVAEGSWRIPWYLSTG